jgi:hypothetical protein
MFLELCCTSQKAYRRVRSTTQELGASREDSFDPVANRMNAFPGYNALLGILLHISNTCCMGATSFWHFAALRRNVLTGPKRTKSTCCMPRWALGSVAHRINMFLGPMFSSDRVAHRTECVSGPQGQDDPHWSLRGPCLE